MFPLHDSPCEHWAKDSPATFTCKTLTSWLLNLSYHALILPKQTLQDISTGGAHDKAFSGHSNDWYLIAMKIKFFS